MYAIRSYYDTAGYDKTLTPKIPGANMSGTTGTIITNSTDKKIISALRGSGDKIVATVKEYVCVGDGRNIDCDYEYHDVNINLGTAASRNNFV